MDKVEEGGQQRSEPFDAAQSKELLQFNIYKMHSNFNLEF